MDFYIATTFAGLAFLSFIVCLFHLLWLNGENRRLILRRQGFEGPLPAFLLGNIPQMKHMLPAAPNHSPNTQEPFPSHHCLMNLFPYLKQWIKQYGQSFLFALGRSQFLYVADPYFVREINCFTSLDMGKPAYLHKDRGALLGKGVITTNGSVWLHQRKTIAPHLFMDKVKDMIQLVVESGGELVKSWGNIIEANGGIADIRVDDHVRNFTSSIISKVVFGDEWQKGMKIFPKSLALINAMSTPTILSGIPFYRYLPTKKNREIWRLEKEIHSTIMDIVKKQEHTESNSKGLLKVIIEGSNGDVGPSTADQFVVDNCKDICIPASEVTAVSAIWGLMLLASHPEWQTRIRTEVSGLCKDGMLNFDILHKMKALRMVVLEVLRLYPVTAFVSRQALQNLKLGHVEIPKGVNIWLWLLELHVDPKHWGPDAEKFNPERFANGISKACNSSQAYIPFGVGARICPGQSLAMTELQVLFAIIVSNFKLTISPSYRHSPQYTLLIQPEFGVNLLIQKI